MDAYDAIMKAAEHVEAYPGEFDFRSTAAPRKAHCGTPGCALGWIGTFYGFDRIREECGYDGPSGVANVVLGIGSACDFYERMRGLGDLEWTTEGVLCANALRAYAKKYHALAKPALHPGFVKLRAELGEATKEFIEAL